MEIRHNTKLLEEAVALVVRRAEIPAKEAEAIAAERMARAAARMRLATGVAIAVAALGIGIALWLGWHAGDTYQVTVKEPYPVPRPTVTVTPEPKVVVMPAPTVTVTSTPLPSPSTVENSAPAVPFDTHTPVVNYTKFASQKLSLFGRQWEVQAGHQFASDTQKDWDTAWCYVNTEVGEVTVRVDLARRLNPYSAPIGPIASAETLQRIGITDAEASEMAAECPWLDGKHYLPQDLTPARDRVPARAVPTELPTASPPIPSSAIGPPMPILPSVDVSNFTAKLFSISGGYDVTGNDLPGMPLQSTSLDDCQKDCADNFTCNAFTFNKKYNKCFLKGKARIAVANEQAITGYKSGDGGINNAPLISKLKVQSKAAVTGKPYRGFVAQSFDICLIGCETDGMYCIGVNYDSSTSECNLFSNVMGVVTAPTMSSAERPSVR